LKCKDFKETYEPDFSRGNIKRVHISAFTNIGECRYAFYPYQGGKMGTAKCRDQKCRDQRRRRAKAAKNILGQNIATKNVVIGKFLNYFDIVTHSSKLMERTSQNGLVIGSM